MDFDHSLNTAMMTLRDVLVTRRDALFISRRSRNADTDLLLRSCRLERGEREAPTTVATTAAKVDEGFSIAVLPFKCTGNIPEMAVFAEGLAEEFAGGFCDFPI